MTRSLLVLSYFPAVWPARSGGEMRLGHLYRALAKGWSVTLISAADGGTRFEEVEHANDFRELRVPKDETWSRAAASLAQAGIGGDLAGLAFALAAEEPDWPLRRLARAAATKASLVVHESPFSEPMFSAEDGLTEIYGAHNHEASLIGEVAGGEGAAQAWSRVWRLERRLARRAALVLAPAREDLERMRVLYGVAPHRLAEAPNGFDPQAAGAVAARRGSASGRSALLFLGSAHPPNVEAARYLAEIAPELPEADIVIAGAAGEALPEPLAENLRRVGPVDEAGKAQLLAQAAAFLNPVDSGSGTSLKALEAVAAGIPLVSTPFGVRGLGLCDGQHGAIRPRGPGFLAGIRAVLADPLRAAMLAANGLGAVEALSWPSIAQTVGALLVEAAEGRLGLSSPPERRLILALNDYAIEGRESGGATRIRETLSRLDADVVLLGFAPRPTVSRIAPNILGIGLPKTPSHKAYERDLATVWDVPAEDVVAALFVAENRALAALAEDLAEEAGAAVFEHCYMAPLADRLGRARPDLPLIYAAHNREAAMKRALAHGNEAGETAAAIVEELEDRMVAASTLVVACSEEDAAAFRDLGARTLMVAHGARVAAGPRPEPEALPVVGFLGSAHAPNREAAAFIAHEIAPRLPQAVFEIVGEVCAALAGPLPENLRLRGALPDAAKSDAMRGWSFALNPVETGGGANLKLADYLAHGLGVVATPFGARGLPLAQRGLGRVVSRADFPGAVAAALADPQGLTAAGERALAFAREHLAWDRLVAPYRDEIDALLARPRGSAPAADIVVATDLPLDTEEGRRQLLAALDGRRAGRVEVLAPLSGPAPALVGVDRVLPVALPEDASAPSLAGALALVEAGARYLHHPAPLAVAGLDPADETDGAPWRLGAAFALLLPARARSLRIAGTSAAPLVLHLSSRQLGGGGVVSYPPVALEDAFELVLPLQGGPRPRLLEGRINDEAGAAIAPQDRPVAAFSAAMASAERSTADWQPHLPLTLDAGWLLSRRAPRLYREASLAASRQGGADPALTAAFARAVAGLGRRGPYRALVLSADPGGAVARAARAAFLQAGWPVSEAEPAARRDDPWSPLQIADQRAGLDPERGLVALAGPRGGLSPRALLAALAGTGLHLDVVTPDGLAARIHRAGRAGLFLPAAPEAWLPACRALVVGGWDEATADLVTTARGTGVPVLVAAGAESEDDPEPGASLEAIVRAIMEAPEP